jgi:hypothetical protein
VGRNGARCQTESSRLRRISNCLPCRTRSSCDPGALPAEISRHEQQVQSQLVEKPCAGGSSRLCGRPGRTSWTGPSGSGIQGRDLQGSFRRRSPARSGIFRPSSDFRHSRRSTFRPGFREWFRQPLICRWFSMPPPGSSPGCHPKTAFLQGFRGPCLLRAMRSGSLKKRADLQV